MKNWEKNIRRVIPYVPGEQPDKQNMIKLNTNENPYPPAPGVQKILNEFESERLKLYPDSTISVLTDELAKRHGLESEQVFVGVGSDDVLAMAFMTFFNSDKPILFPDITYSFYDVWAELFRIPYERIPLKKDFHINAEDYYKKNGGIIFPNPNAPTALYEKKELIEDIIKHNQDVIVIVDEAYIDFSKEGSMQSLLKTYQNLLVVQTFSKSRSMAGMRIGYMMGSKELIRAINDVKYSFNSYTMSTVAQYVGAESVKDENYFTNTVKKIIKTREAAKIKLKELGFSFPDSQANFIFASHKIKPANEIFAELKKRNIYVRYFDKPRIDNYLRITIGTEEQMEKLFAALEEILI